MQQLRGDLGTSLMAEQPVCLVIAGTYGATLIVGGHMGTLSKRRLEDFGLDVKQRIEHFRQHVGDRIEHITDDAEVRGGDFLRQFEKVPSSTWLAIAAGSLAGGLILLASGRS